MLLGFLFIILLKAQGVTGSQAVVQETTAMPSLMQSEQENQQLSADNEKLQLELKKYAQGQSASTLANQQLQDAKMNAGLIGCRVRPANYAGRFEARSCWTRRSDDLFNS